MIRAAAYFYYAAVVFGVVFFAVSFVAMHRGLPPRPLLLLPLFLAVACIGIELALLFFSK